MSTPLLWPPFADAPVSKTLDDLKRLTEEIMPKVTRSDSRMQRCDGAGTLRVSAALAWRHDGSRAVKLTDAEALERLRSHAAASDG